MINIKGVSRRFGGIGIYLIFVLLISVAFAQENTEALCIDGIDNDSDSTVDCDDSDCVAFDTCAAFDCTSFTGIDPTSFSVGVDGAGTEIDFTYNNGLSATMTTEGEDLVTSDNVAYGGAVTSGAFFRRLSNVGVEGAKLCTLTFPRPVTDFVLEFYDLDQTTTSGCVTPGGFAEYVEDFSVEPNAVTGGAYNTATGVLNGGDGLTTRAIYSLDVAVTEISFSTYRCVTSLAQGFSVGYAVCENTCNLCTDGVDNDEDGLTDFDDDECDTFVACKPETCGDEIDNDGDGLTDCDDADCSIFIACQDTDGDTILDGEDCDDDNDGILDTVECATEGVVFLNETFGSGDKTTSEFIDTDSYSYWDPENGASIDSAGRFWDSEYAVMDPTAIPTTAGVTDESGWFSDNDGVYPSDHTGNTSGRALVVNATEVPGEFYRRTVTGLNATAIYEFSAWILKACDGCASLPNVTFRVEDISGNTLAAVNTGDIPHTVSFEWLNYGFQFLPGQTQVQLVMQNNAPGGGGNDLMIDDIVFVEKICEDTDNDNTPDYLDTDSDGDGCPDAIEGDGDVLYSSLDDDDRISGDISDCGLPTLVNATGDELGQGLGDAQDSDTNSCDESTADACADTIDNDGDDLIDCDDDDCFATGVCPEDTATLCADTFDNDGDGNTDCDDEDCQALGDTVCPENTLALCGDGIDNDGDGTADCEEADCLAFSASLGCSEATATFCADTIDNDGDGLIDCDDPDCQALGSTVCSEDTDALCSDGVDNDGDALPDCQDPDCAAFDDCLDTDNDTILNGEDCDDDNDGILDDEECDLLVGDFTIDGGGADGNESGTVTFSDGSSSTWSIVTSGTNDFSVLNTRVPENGGLNFQYLGTTPWDLTSTFSVPDAETENIRIVLYGNIGLPTMHSAFETYTISWVGGDGNATVVDPDGEIVEGDGYSLTNGGSFTQSQTHYQSLNSGAILNGDLDWYVILPEGATELSINATGGDVSEGFRFVAAKICDTDGDGIYDRLDNDSDGDGCPDAVEGDGTIGYESLDANDRLTGAVSACGLPTIADAANDESGQGVGTSTDATDATACEEATAASCVDGIDNQGDGLIDCDDADCIALGDSVCPENTIALCSDGTDNDGDGLADCLEPDCVQFAETIGCSESTAATCADGLDNDNDGTIDCADSDCMGLGSTVCSEDTEALCSDGLDNDGDGSPDCDDSDCAAFDICQDPDNDTIPNNEDCDDDNDGILDTNEGTGDTDSDGLLDTVDNDSDGDGCPDAIEGDGTIGYESLDANDRLTGAVSACGLPTIADAANDESGQGVGTSADATDATACEENTATTCADGVDNDGDDLIDCDDTECIALGDSVCPENTIALCSDGVDNDGDGTADCLEPDCFQFAATLGCTEGTPASCVDGLDNDNDGATDCDDVECQTLGSTICPENTDALCSDGVDNDGDGTIDCDDPDCSVLGDPTCGENTVAYCTDGLDNDGDGLIDCADPDCFEFAVEAGCSENTPATCADGVDNDGDGDTDCDDVNCQSLGSTVCPENTADLCSDGVDNDGDGTIDCDDPDCSALGDPTCAENTAPYCSDGLDNDGDGTIDCDDADCVQFAQTLGCAENTADKCVDGLDNDGDGTTDCDDLDCAAFTTCPESTPEACTDGIDNDGDGDTDCVDVDCLPYALCPENTVAACEDGLDNDNDGAIDCADSDCQGVVTCTEDNTQYCEDGIDNDGDGTIDCGDPDCAEVLTYTCNENNAQSCSDGVDNDGDGSTDCDDQDCQGIVTCPEDTHQKCTDGVDNDEDGSIDCADSDCMAVGPPTCQEDSGVTCFDGLDNDGDTLIDCLDPDCDAFTGCQENNSAHCEDGIDNDEDGLADCADPDCHSFTECQEDTALACSDGLDNDFDGLIDCDDTECADFDACDDPDNDTIPNLWDLDDDNDGILDTVEGVGDTDSDGIPDSLDTDSDGDGCADAVEGTATFYLADDLDGTTLQLLGSVDADGIPEVATTAGQGIGTSQDGTVLDADCTPPDNDGDTIPDHLDSDDDNDGILDTVEGDGDPDGDTIPSWFDSDSDGDGCLDGVEGGGDFVFIDHDSFGALLGEVDDSGIPVVADGGQSVGDAQNPLTVQADCDDSDGDTIPDATDLDDDNDGIPDLLEGETVDTDGDTIPNSLDLDSDEDGCYDAVEGDLDTIVYTDLESNGSLSGDIDTDGVPILASGGQAVGTAQDADSRDENCLTDTDSDTIPDVDDLDDDNDGILDSVEGTEDTDGDTIPNDLDADSDGDGCWDALEGFYDPLGAGDSFITEPDGFVFTDVDADGRLTGDITADGVPEVATTTTAEAPFVSMAGQAIGDSQDDATTDDLCSDADGDTILDPQDLDDDNDGILDTYEGSGDVDGDTIPNSLDLDSDGDGCYDAVEGTSVFYESELDTTGAIPGDIDEDGIPSLAEGGQFNGSAHDPTIQNIACLGDDTDGDTIPDSIDLDNDNDGILDTIEISNARNDGDTDGDTIPDYLDTDSDGDGIYDVEEANGVDNDGDGLVDGSVDDDGVPTLADGGLAEVDTDEDGIVDSADLDSDNDGILDEQETDFDSDADGIGNWRDSESDGDGCLDAVEGDNDFTTGVIDTEGRLLAGIDTDGVPLLAGGGQDFGSSQDVSTQDEQCIADSDGDTIPDDEDLDDDNDGILDTVEGDGDDDLDTIPNIIDLDSDNDGCPDAVEGGGDFSYIDLDNDTQLLGGIDDTGIPLVADAGQTVGDAHNADLVQASCDDYDGDGILDDADLDDDNDGILDTVEGTDDFDGDTIPNHQDEDSDNDGCPDAIDGDGAFELSDVDTVTWTLLGDVDDSGVPTVAGTDGQALGTAENPSTQGDGCDFTDTDGDTIPDYLDTDDDNDGLLDSIEGETTDTDGDTIPNSLDTDSDGDGCWDALEGDAGFVSTQVYDDGSLRGAVHSTGVPIEATLDGQAIGTSQSADDQMDACGDNDADTVPDSMDLDDDNDGILDTVEGNGDIDGDTIPNSMDLDSDGDGCVDAIEGADSFMAIDLNDFDMLAGVVATDGVPVVVGGGTLTLTGQAVGAAHDALQYDEDCFGGDYDEDTIPDSIDLDDDNDGILDVIEGNGDSDADTIPNSLDRDSDGDGCWDALEGSGSIIGSEVDTDGAITGALGTNGVPTLIGDGQAVGSSQNSGLQADSCNDSDGDTIPDGFDLDDDNDGILDIYEGNGDIDGDTIPASLDLDSDGDGCPDAVEGTGTFYLGDLDAGLALSGGIDTNGIPTAADGGQQLGDAHDALIQDEDCDDADGDTIPNTDDLDDDNDGILDTDEGDGETDTDGDGLADSLDPDSDNDGIFDSIEADATDVDEDGQADGTVDANGVPADANGGVTATDTDGDTIPDYSDLDTDNDGILDTTEGSADTDGDTIPDYRDLDSDADGCVDALDAAGGVLDTDIDASYMITGDIDENGVPTLVNGGQAIGTAQDDTSESDICTDTDGDTIVDATDLDDDNDGILDTVEGTGDTDGDTILDSLDLDSDGDGCPDSIEGGSEVLASSLSTTTAITGTVDTDGIPTLVGTGQTVGNAQNVNVQDPVCADSDGDTILDTSDLDDDNDGIADSVEGDGDPDGDTIPNYLDLDSDNDGCPDAVEGDGFISYDNLAEDTSIMAPFSDSGVPNLAYTGQGAGDAYNESVQADDCDLTLDGDGDTIPNIADLDDDNDGIPDLVEMAQAINGGDTDGDGIADKYDLDADNDGLLDTQESGLNGEDLDGDGRLDGPVSGDGIPDIVQGQPNSGTVTFTLLDTDGDDRPDSLDLDSDNDGINDVIESDGEDADADGQVDGSVDDTGIATGVTDGGNPTVDTDGDTIPDHQDLDSDNDGITDVLESGNSDDDNDGMVGTGVATDTDLDGIADDVDTLLGSGESEDTAPTDTDEDGIADYRALDSDADGCPDALEGGDSFTHADLDTLTALAGGVQSNGLPDLVLEGQSIGSAQDATLQEGCTEDTAAVCTDGLDNDQDDLVDCADPDCAALVQASCNENTSTACADGVDNDGDGLADCDDSDCAGIVDCAEGTVVNCVDGIDNDGDGLIDCGDSDCLSVVANGCDESTATACADGLDNDNDGLTDCDDQDCQTLVSCDEDDSTKCSDGVDNDGNGLIDCDDSSCEDLAPCIETTADACADGIDNDGDGLMDCNDPDCATFAGDLGCNENTATLCADGIDNDGDGLADCGDSDCVGIVECVEATSANCADGVDNDDDGLMDCSDPDCSAFFASNGCNENTATACADGVDNDGDGVTDCEDDDCIALGTDVCDTQTCFSFTSADTDGDIYTLSQEYAYGASPTKGDHLVYVSDVATTYRSGLVIAENTTGLETTVGATVEATLTVPTSVTDATYVLEFIANLEEAVEDGSHTEWTELDDATVTDNGDGTETHTWADLQTMSGSTDQGFVRLKATTPCDPEGSYSLIQGWEVVTHEGRLQTEGMTLLNHPLYTGVITSSDDSTITIDQALSGEDASTKMTGTCYLEVTSGDYEGHRFDLTSGMSDTVTVDLTSENNTNTSLPDLSGSNFVIREHHTLGELYQTSEYEGGFTQSAADQIQIYNGSGYDIYYNNFVGVWTNVDQRDSGMDVIIPPGQGVFVQHTSDSDQNVELRVGAVRYNAFMRPLYLGDSGLNHVALGFPVSQTPSDLEMNSSNGFTAGFTQSASDQIQVWDGDYDGNVDTRGYTIYALPLTDYWYNIDAQGVDTSSDTLFIHNRAPFVEVGADVADWTHEMPYSVEGWSQN